MSRGPGRRPSPMPSPMRRATCLLLLLMAALPALAACAPRLQPPSLQSATPAMTHDALVMDDGIALPMRGRG